MSDTTKKLCIGLLLILVTVVYFYGADLPQIRLKLQPFSDKELHVVSGLLTLPTPKADPNTYTVPKSTTNAKTKSGVNTPVNDKSNVNSKSKFDPKTVINEDQKAKEENSKNAKKVKVPSKVITKSKVNINSRSKLKTNDIKSSKKHTESSKKHTESSKKHTESSKKHTESSVNTTTQSVNAKKTNRTKYLIYLCDSRRSCGGFGDRQRGITYAFMAAIQLDRKFGLIMSTPCDIRQFFIPNKYNWIIPETDLIGKPQKIIDSVNYGSVDLSNDTTEVIYLKTNSPGNDYVYRRIRNKLPQYLKGGTTRSHIFKLIWESLMKPSHHVTNHFKTLALSKNMTCAHVRIGKSKNLPNDPARNNITNVPKLWDFMEKLNKKNKIFVATDSVEVRDSARRRFAPRYFDSEGKIVHIDRQRGMNSVCLGFETAIIDQIILSKCSVLIVSISGFSVRAAMLRNNKKDLYYFHGTEIKPFKLP